ncbi:MAG TPA: DUF1565 domain-containing protein, partial [Chitinophagaceae bacterium]|nr:DUF1565 domain-containing protein [Chitinophagaceae bacterium]
MKKIIILIFPFILSALYASASPGNVLVPAKWYVNNNSLTGDIFTTAIGNDGNTGTSASPFATLQFAMGAAQAGDSIFIDAGTYVTADFTITKGVNFVGTNYKISPNNPADKLSANPAINAESIISGATLTPGTSNISLLGLMFDAGNKIVINFDNTGTSNSIGNFRFIKNRVKMNASVSQVVIIGTGNTSTSAASLVNSIFEFTDNRFEKFNASANKTLSINLVKNVTLTDNSFVVTGTAFRTQAALDIGSAGAVDQLVVSNNVVDQASYFLLGSRFVIATFTGNIISRTPTTMQVNNQVFEGSDFQFNNNVIDASSGINSSILFMRISGGAIGASNNITFENNTINMTAIPAVTFQLVNFNVNIISSVVHPVVIIRGNKITYSGNLSSVEGQNIRPIV